MIAIALKDIEKYYGANKVINSLTFEINEGEKTAFIGSNGCGKTTAFKIIAGVEGYDGGMLALKKNLTIGYLEQMTEGYSGLPVNEVLLQGAGSFVELRAEISALENAMAKTQNQAELERYMKKYGVLQDRFEAIDGYSLESRIEGIVRGLNISEDIQNSPFDLLSGGEKTKVLFARMLISKPELLLLDEPTNHLDIEAIEWLEEFIRKYEGTVLVISHDRYFLDKAVTRIIEIEYGECEEYGGNYSYYMEEKERRLLVEFANYQDQQKKIKSMEEAIKRLREWGIRGDNNKFFRRAESMQKSLDKIVKLKRPVMEKKSIDLNFEISGRSGKDVAVCEGISKCFENKRIFDEADFFIRFKERIGILGPNGTGKSTLIKMLMGMESQDLGHLYLGSGVHVGYLPQVIEMEDGNRTVLEEFRSGYICTEGEARGILAKFLFYKDSVFKRVKDLSGGEKTRIKLAQLMYSDVNLLILDEPTNHLDIETREVLEDALSDYEGTILFISHDRYFVNKLAHRIYHIEDYKLIAYSGNYDYFKEQQEKKKLYIRNVPAAKEIQPKPKKTVEKGEPKINWQNELSKIEERIEYMEAVIDKLKKKMEEPEIASDYTKLQNLGEELQLSEKELEQAYEEWSRVEKNIQHS